MYIFSESQETRSVTTTTNDLSEVMIQFEYNPVLVGVALAVIALIMMGISLWRYLRMGPHEQFELSLSASVSSQILLPLYNASKLCVQIIQW